MGYREVGERLVAAASPRFKDFRVDFEKISNAASKAARERRDGLAPEDGIAMFTDADWDLRIPLQRRYGEAGALDAIAHYHSKRFKLLLGRNEPWPDPPAEDALRLFTEHGRADVGVALIRTYVDMQHKRLKRDYSKRSPRGPRTDLDEGTKAVIGTIDRIIASAIPDRKGELLRAMALLASYVEEHGGDADRVWLEAVRRELWMEKRA